MQLGRRWEVVSDFLRGLSIAGAVAFGWGALVSAPSPATFTPRSDEISPVHPTSDSRSPEPAPPAAPDRVATLAHGETLGDLLRDVGLANSEIDDVASTASRFVNPRQLQPGLKLAAFLEREVPSRLELALRGKGTLTLARVDESWVPSWRAYDRETRVRVVRGALDGSLDRSLANLGADPELAFAMAEVLQWDLDFTRDLQNGDQFEALYEEIFLEGEYFGLGRVLALSYTQPRRQLEVFRFGDGESFYDALGRPLEKMFLRAPLPYSRVTSRFSSRRFHPLLKIARPHHGVDYGAAAGTPVRVTAAGTVTMAGWDGGGGKTVLVRHANGYLTGYLHLSRFAAGIRAGASVRQGEVIGYVGATGLATAPHLDYRVQHHGRWIDPLSLPSQPAEPLSPMAREEFVVQRDAMRMAISAGGGFSPVAPRVRGPEGTVLAALASAPPLKTRSAKKR